MRKGMYIVRNLMLKNISENLHEYIMVLLIFVTGIIIGMALLQKLPEFQRQELSKFTHDMINTVKEEPKVDHGVLLKKSVANNLIFATIMWLSGSIIIGLPIVYILVCIRGFLLGYTLSALVSVLGIGYGTIFILATMFLQYLIYIPVILALAVSSAKLCKSVFKKGRSDDIKYLIIKHTIFSVALSLFLILSSFVEVYLSGGIFNLIIEMF